MIKFWINQIVSANNLYCSCFARINQGIKTASWAKSAEGFGTDYKFIVNKHDYSSLQTSPKWSDNAYVRLNITKFKHHNVIEPMCLVLGSLCRCNYCDNVPLLDSNQYLLLASLVWWPFTPTGLKLSNLGISYNPFTPSFLLFEAFFL